ncbi:MAG: hypothetical protein VXA66_00060, partial [Alphaproteobacteria bacterium]
VHVYIEFNYFSFLRQFSTSDFYDQNLVALSHVKAKSVVRQMMVLGVVIQNRINTVKNKDKALRLELGVPNVISTFKRMRENTQDLAPCASWPLSNRHI